MIFTKRGPRVAEEAAALARARHPGVVELVGADDEVLRTRLVEGRPLAEVGPLAAEEVAGLAAAVASTLADLHERGVVHGGLDATHVLLAPDGRPVLCSFGRGGDPADDVAALGHLVTDLLARAPAALPRPLPLPRRRRGGRRLGPLLAPPAAPALAALAAEAADPDPARRPSARQLAAAVHRQVPTAPPRPPTPRPLLPLPPPPGDRPLAAARLGRGAAGLLAVLALFWASSYALADRRRPGAQPPAGTAPPPAPAPPAPADAAGAAADGARDGPVARRVWPPEPVEFRDGVLTVGGARYAVGRPGDQVVAGDWECTGRTTAVLLRPSTGEVFAFDGWPHAGGELAARPVARVPGATAVRPADTDGDGCTDVEVVVGDGPPQRVEVGG